MEGLDWRTDMMTLPKVRADGLGRWNQRDSEKAPVKPQERDNGGLHQWLQ